MDDALNFYQNELMVVKENVEQKISKIQKEINKLKEKENKFHQILERIQEIEKDKNMTDVLKCTKDVKLMRLFEYQHMNGTNDRKLRDYFLEKDVQDDEILGSIFQGTMKDVLNNFDDKIFGYRCLLHQNYNIPLRLEVISHLIHEKDREKSKLLIFYHLINRNIDDAQSLFDEDILTQYEVEEYIENHDILRSLCHLYGIGFEENEKLGFEILQNCLEESGENLFYIGDCYANGFGVQQDLVSAMKYYQMSADCGNSMGQYALGASYEEGNIFGNEINMPKALNYYQESATKGDLKSQYSLGMSYLFGDNDNKDADQAFQLFYSLSSRGNSDGQAFLGHCYELGEGVNMDVRKAFEYYELSSLQGNDFGTECLATCYERGIGVERNFEKAIELYESIEEEERSSDTKEILLSLKKLVYSKI